MVEKATPVIADRKNNPFVRIGQGFLGVIRFVKQVVAEIRKVVTPTVREWAGWCVASGIFVLLLMALVSGMDFGLGKLTLWVFGGWAAKAASTIPWTGGMPQRPNSKGNASSPDSTTAPSWTEPSS